MRHPPCVPNLLCRDPSRFWVWCFSQSFACFAFLLAPCCCDSAGFDFWFAERGGVFLRAFSGQGRSAAPMPFRRQPGALKPAGRARTGTRMAQRHPVSMLSVWFVSFATDCGCRWCDVVKSLLPLQITPKAEHVGQLQVCRGEQATAVRPAVVLRSVGVY